MLNNFGGGVCTDLLWLRLYFMLCFSLAVLHSLLHLPLTENNFHYYELLLFYTPPRGYYSSDYLHLKSCFMSLIYIVSIPLQNSPRGLGTCRKLTFQMRFATRLDSDATATRFPIYSLLRAYESFHFLQYKNFGSEHLQGRWDILWDFLS